MLYGCNTALYLLMSFQMSTFGKNGILYSAIAGNDLYSGLRRIHSSCSISVGCLKKKKKIKLNINFLMCAWDLTIYHSLTFVFKLLAHIAYNFAKNTNNFSFHFFLFPSDPLK